MCRSYGHSCAFAILHCAVATCHLYGWFYWCHLIVAFWFHLNMPLPLPQHWLHFANAASTVACCIPMLLCSFTCCCSWLSKLPWLHCTIVFVAVPLCWLIIALLSSMISPVLICWRGHSLCSNSCYSCYHHFLTMLLPIVHHLLLILVLLLPISLCYFFCCNLFPALLLLPPPLVNIYCKFLHCATSTVMTSTVATCTVLPPL